MSFCKELAGIEKVINNGPFGADWESLKGFKVPGWYEYGKFGIFIHWGVYSVPAFGSEWYPRQMYLEDKPEFEHHVKTYGPQKDFGYKDFIPMFKAEKFDPKFWAELFKKSGATYVVPVAEHHDGFAMYDCKFHEWTSVNMGPKRDVIGELSKAIREQGLVFGLSSHREEHCWFFDGGMNFESDVQDPKYRSFYGQAHPKEQGPDEEFLNEWLVYTCDLVDKYQPQLVWFDWWINNEAFQPYLQKFASYYYNKGAEWGKEVAINYKETAFPEEAGVFDIERGQLTDIRPRFWQTDTAVAKNSWGYVEGMDYKTADSIVADLIDIVSKNGSLLLNIGPRADGTIPDEDQQILLEIGKWLKTNGEAIYGTKPWKKFGEGPTEIVEGAFNDVKRTPFTSKDIRFTTKDNTIYAHILGQVDTDSVTVESMAKGECADVKNIRLLGSCADLDFTQDERGLTVKLTGGAKSEYPVVLKAEL